MRKPGFDLRSRLGRKKNETELTVTKTIEVDAQQKPNQLQQKEEVKQEKQDTQVEAFEERKEENDNVDEGKNDGYSYHSNDINYVTISSRRSVVEIRDDKEAELDKKIKRIQKMNDEIRKRQKEVEREKMLFAV